MGFFDPFGGNTGGSGSGGSISIDTTLTQSGKAADAKVTGDKIKKIETDGIATINEIKVVGELDSVDDLNIAGKVFESEDSTGEIFNDYENNIADGDYAHAEGFTTNANGLGSHAEGNSTIAYGKYSHAEGTSSGVPSTLELTSSTTNDEIINAWHSKNKFSLAKGAASHVEGNNNLALGNYSHAEGNQTYAEGFSSHAEGDYTRATNSSAHVEGYWSAADGKYSHAEGNSTLADGECSHAEGGHTDARGKYSHAEGHSTDARGEGSHAEGHGTRAYSNCQHTQGKFNVEDSNNKYVFIIGNGTSETTRSNAIAIDWDGKIYVNNSSTGIDLRTVVSDIANRYTKTETDNAIITKIAEVIADAPEDFDTLKEISAWIEEHADDAAAMNLEIQTLKTDKANKADVYTKTEVDGKVNTINSSITGINGNIGTINTEISELKDNKMSYSDIETVTEEEFNNLTEKTALYYFIKEE